MSVLIQDHNWIVTTVIALFGIIAVHRLTEKRSKAIEFRAAAKEFRNIVLNELKGIYPSVTNWPQCPSALLTTKFNTLQIAAMEFSASLPWYRRFMFKRAWRIYCVGTNPVSKEATQEYHQYMGFTIDNHYINPQKRLKENIDRLLKYSKT